MNPPVSPEVDLRDFAYMPLDVVRLRDSDIAARATGEEFRAAVFLWCASWHQVPAASLPDDEIILSHLAGYGRALAEWALVKAGALRGWIKCGDGRLYHPVVAEKANEAWLQKRIFAWRKECDRIRKENATRVKASLLPLEFPSRPTENAKIPAETTQPNNGIPSEIALKGNGTERNGTDIKIDSSPPTPFGGENADIIDKIYRVFPKAERASRSKVAPLIARLSETERSALAAGCAAYAADFAAKPTTQPKGLERFIRDRIWENYGRSGAVTQSLFEIPRESPAGEAWDAVYRAQGKPGAPWTNGRWRFPSEWPPASPGPPQARASSVDPAELYAQLAVPAP